MQVSSTHRAEKRLLHRHQSTCTHPNKQLRS